MWEMGEIKEPEEVRVLAEGSSPKNSRGSAMEAKEGSLKKQIIVSNIANEAKRVETEKAVWNW